MGTLNFKLIFFFSTGIKTRSGFLELQESGGPSQGPAVAEDGRMGQPQGPQGSAGTCACTAQVTSGASGATPTQSMGEGEGSPLEKERNPRALHA